MAPVVSQNTLSTQKKVSMSRGSMRRQNKKITLIGVGTRGAPGARAPPSFLSVPCPLYMSCTTNTYCAPPPIKKSFLHLWNPLSGSRTPKQHKLRNVPMRKLCKNHRKGQRSLLNNVQEMKPAEHARGQYPNKTLPMMGARG